MKPEPTEKEVIIALAGFKAGCTRVEISTEIKTQHRTIVNVSPTEVSVDVIHENPSHLVDGLNESHIYFGTQKYILWSVEKYNFETVGLTFLEDRRNAK